MKEYIELPKELDNIENHFKVSAGPGAGKTTWLVDHIKNVLKNSKRLEKSKKIGCITYTRIGAETIEKKVKKLSGTNRIEVGTIHSFLYKNVIKPFCYLIEYDDETNKLFAIDELSGHIENRPNYDRVSSWINSIGTKYKYLYENKKKDGNGQTNLYKTYKRLQEFEWNYDGEIVTAKLKKNYFSNYPFPSSKIYEYKLANWRKGIMHHEDVLYFTHLIFKKNPRIIEFISNKFPYLFLDEFQDTTPLQTLIINQISKYGTVIGVIGDPAQSIFEFAGAQRKDFNNFSLPNINFFNKSYNYRSTKKIIDFLKNLRDDILQIPGEEDSNGEEIVLLVGKAEDAVEYVKQLFNEKVTVLCRYNKDLNKLEKKFEVINKENLIDLLYLEDSNCQRPLFIHSLIKAYDYDKNFEHKKAVKEIKKNLRKAAIEGIEKRRIAIEIIEFLKENLDLSVSEIYNHLQKKLKKDCSVKNLVGLRTPKEIHKKNLREFLPFISKKTNFDDKFRNIHQSKGDEFNNLLVCIFEKIDKNGKILKSLDKILKDHIFDAKKNIKIDNEIGEETRLLYVAFSRAKQRLFVNIPSITDVSKKKFESIGVIEYIFLSEVL